MSRFVKIAKCPNCLPDAKGAYFDAVGFSPGDEKVWVCRNCGHKTPRTRIKPSGKPTPSQERVMDRLKFYGWTIDKVEMMGRGVWVTASKDRGHPNLNLFSGDSLYGMIGPRGSYSLKLQRFGGEVDIEDEIGMSVYLK